MSDEPTRLIRKPGAAAPAGSGVDQGTEVMGGGRTNPAADPDPGTRLFRPSRPQPAVPSSSHAPSAAPSAAQRQAPAAGVRDQMDNPVVGWLVVISGPGQGSARELGYGMNSIGRSAEDRVSLDFGDEEISRHAHAVVTYDPRGRRFYAQHGSSVNLSYLNDAPLLQPTLLQGGEVLSLGRTRLRFVAFCGEAFDWQDSDA